MKKTFLLLSTIIAIPLMSGCSSNRVKPTEFLDFGEKVSLDDFNEKLAGVKEDNEFYKEERLSSLKRNSYFGASILNENQRNGKLISKNEEKTVANTEAKYDTSKLLAETKDVQYSSKSGKDSYGTSSSSSTSKKVSGLQQVISGENVYFAAIDHIRKEYGPAGEKLDADHKAEDVFDSLIKAYATSAVKSFEDETYKGEDEDESRLYSYYVNNSIFTIKYVFEDEVKETIVIGDEEATNYTLKIKIEKTYQISMLNGSFSYRTAYESSSETKYERSYEEHIVGDSHATYDKQYSTLSFTYADVKLKDTDLSKYIKIGFPEDNMK